MNRRVLTCLLFATAAFMAPASIKADGGGYYGYGFPWFGYGNNGPAAYALGNIPAPPYFALHPPVYYSHPVARTYGHSPFACSCDCHHGRRQRVQRVFVNPYVEEKPKEPATKADPNVAAVPLRKSNPFFQPGNKPETGLVSR